jgi:hypothetical protein
VINKYNKLKRKNMPLTFKDYLSKNSITNPINRNQANAGSGYYAGYNNPHNKQQIGDVVGGSISSTLPDEDNEENDDLLQLDVENTEDQDQMDPQQTTVDEQDPNRQGAIRVVKGAHLVYKRESEDGTFSELWVYKIGDQRTDEFKIRKNILAGTDIPIDNTASEDGTQTYSLWTSGNVQMIKIEGLPN